MIIKKVCLKILIVEVVLLEDKEKLVLTDEKVKQCLWKVVGDIILQNDNSQKNDDSNFDNQNIKDNNQSNDKHKEKEMNFLREEGKMICNGSFF